MQRGQTQHYTTAEVFCIQPTLSSLLSDQHTSRFSQSEQEHSVHFDLSQYVRANSNATVLLGFDFKITQFCLKHGSGLWQVLKSGCTGGRKDWVTGVKLTSLWAKYSLLPYFIRLVQTGKKKN